MRTLPLNAELSMRCDGGKSVAIFYVDAKIRPNDGRIKGEEDKIVLSGRALKETFQRIGELNLVEATPN